jgi:DNA anti-recombination protein RmuC
MNYADNSQVKGEVQKQVARLNKIAQNPKVQGQMDLESILEDMLLATNQLLFHLTLK